MIHMDKSTHFFGQSVFGQLISLIDENLINMAINRFQSDKYVKKFSTKDQLISMLFCVLGKCTSLREVCGAMLGLKGKTKHFSLQHLPKRSTLSDANKIRPHEVFEMIYYGLLKQYKHVISDSRFLVAIKKQVKIFDSTTISLFQEILRCVGRKPQNGKSKGGIKVHTVINADEKVPEVIWHTDARTHDHTLLSKLTLNENIIYVFDLGYTDYKMYQKFTQHHTGFVTRLKDNALYEQIVELNIPTGIYNGIIKDEIIEIEVKQDNGKKEGLILRRIAFWDDKNKRVFVYLTNLLDMRSDIIAALYKTRWQIELLFKQLKQNFPLKYFLGDNQNAIKIQIWCALIANLLLTVIQKTVKKRSWSFSNIVSFVKLHLFNYLHLIRFFEDPEKDWEHEILDPQLTFF